MTGSLRFFALLGAMMVMLVSTAQAKEVIVLNRSGKANEMRFDPEHVTVNPGDTVTWKNDADMFHSIKSEVVPEGATPFMSKGLYKKGDAWSYTFTASGDYKYFCVPHRGMGMVGSVTVAPAKKP